MKEPPVVWLWLPEATRCGPDMGQWLPRHGAKQPLNTTVEAASRAKAGRHRDRNRSVRGVARDNDAGGDVPREAPLFRPTTRTETPATHAPVLGVDRGHTQCLTTMPSDIRWSPTVIATRTAALEKLRAGAPLDAKEQRTHQQGLVSALRQVHDELDTTIAAAYGLPATATDDEILTHLVTLNARRAAEEARGEIRWLRPSFQKSTSAGTQIMLATGEAPPRIPRKTRNPTA